MRPRAPHVGAGSAGFDDAQPPEVAAIEAAIAREQRIGLVERVRADEEVGHDPVAAAPAGFPETTPQQAGVSRGTPVSVSSNSTVVPVRRPRRSRTRLGTVIWPLEEMVEVIAAMVKSLYLKSKGPGMGLV